MNGNLICEWEVGDICLEVWEMGIMQKNEGRLKKRECCLNLYEKKNLKENIKFLI